MLWYRIDPLWLALPAAVFVALLVLHEKVLRRLRRSRRAEKYYEQGIARLEDRWVGAGEPGERFRAGTHPYSEDLDLFGRGSVFELLCGARTRAGEDTLAAWLNGPAPIEEVRARQKAVQELRGMLDLREDLALLGEDIRSGVHAEELAAWGRERPVLEGVGPRLTTLFLALLLVGVVAGWAVGALPSQLILLVLAAEAGLSLRYRKQVQHVVESVERPSRDLALLSQILVRMERERFTSARLMELRAMLDTDGHPPSWQIARLHRWIELLDSRDHLLTRVIGPPLLWTTQVAFAIENWRARCGRSVGPWLTALGEMEALCSLARYAYEHPNDPFPQLIEGGACYDGVELGHPLLPEEKMVRNSLLLDEKLALLVVSGSNMSGKSTLLRTVGVNAVLAFAGAPVRAVALKLSPLSVGASIRVTDSLRGGSSRFYAEITRLRQIVDLAMEGRPVLFLLDELLHGTNSHDRRIGAEAVVRELLTRGSIGLLTTHDLALADIAEALAPRAANVHFEDHLVNGRITFDYKMQKGVVRKSNALELMRSVGLDV